MLETWKFKLVLQRIVWESRLDARRMQERENIIVTRGGASNPGCCNEEASMVVGCSVLVGRVRSEPSQMKNTCVVGALVHIDSVLRVFPARIVISEAIIRGLACVSVTHAHGVFRGTWLSDQELCTVLRNMTDTYEGKIVRWMEEWSTINHIGYHGQQSDISQEGCGRPEERARTWQASQKAAQNLRVLLFDHNSLLNINLLKGLFDLGIDEQLIVTVIAINDIFGDDVELICYDFVWARVSELIKE